MKNTRAMRNKRLFVVAEKVVAAIQQETEECLQHTEEVVKNFFPARYVKSALNKTAALLNDEGVEPLFDNTISREAIMKTAAQQVTVKELMEAVETIKSAFVDELEEVLEDADEVMDGIVEQFEEKDQFEAEAKLKGIVERKLASKGIKCKFARQYSVKK